MSFGQLLVDTTPQYKNVILEEFTGIHCMFCPDGHVIAQNIKNVYPNDVFVLNLHTGGYAYPNQGEPDFRVGENDSQWYLQVNIDYDFCQSLCNLLWQNMKLKIYILCIQCLIQAF